MGAKKKHWPGQKDLTDIKAVDSFHLKKKASSSSDINSMTTRTRRKSSNDIDVSGAFKVMSSEDSPTRQSRHCRCSDLEELPRPRILLLGRTGRCTGVGVGRVFSSQEKLGLCP